MKPDQTFFWRELRHLALWLITFVTVGGAAAMFLIMPRHAQAVTGFILILVTSFCLAAHQQTRKRK